MQKYTPIAFEINLRPEGFVFDVGSLIAALMGLKDLRDARGLRYTLVTVLVYVILAKLSGEDFLRGIAQWVKERKEILASVLGLAKPQAPCYTTDGRILGQAVAGEQFEQVTRAFFAGLPGAGRTILIALDGKTLRGTLPFGSTRGVHLLAAFFPGEGLVFAQVEVAQKENEIPAAPRARANRRNNPQSPNPNSVFAVLAPRAERCLPARPAGTRARAFGPGGVTMIRGDDIVPPVKVWGKFQLCPTLSIHRDPMCNLSFRGAVCATRNLVFAMTRLFAPLKVTKSCTLGIVLWNRIKHIQHSASIIAQLAELDNSMIG